MEIVDLRVAGTIGAGVCGPFG